ncbi:type VI secretion system accessory protein TagJ [Luteolibacter sp. SL250]|uniref:type VI secretion system accessory protein TagJ n=1 Tax=Luteolibacter sp. SL250 TaxID=2995170 RepID=UPI00227052D9|nr:type VI secretion system accessory protein TagJ [Luteolibacter sp. SL250]WAC17857.1 type VI secretion system accessory protein TagJ [Luteolibacter sp. SL250]
MFAIHGEWSRAAEQLENALQLGGDPGLAVYLIILKTISGRDEVLRGLADPHFPACDSIPDWYPGWKAALEALHGGSPEPLAAAAADRADALDTITGFNEEYEFEGFRNCDTRLCGVFEGIFEGKYSWLPFEQVLRIAVPARPEMLHDLLWLPVMIHLRKGAPLKGYLFSTYPGTAGRSDDAARLARDTGWDERFDTVDVGFGTQLFALGAEVVPVFSLGQCCLGDLPDATPASPVEP